MRKESSSRTEGRATSSLYLHPEGPDMPQGKGTEDPGTSPGAIAEPVPRRAQSFRLGQEAEEGSKLRTK